MVPSDKAKIQREDIARPIPLWLQSAMSPELLYPTAEAMPEQCDVTMDGQLRNESNVTRMFFLIWFYMFLHDFV